MELTERSEMAGPLRVERFPEVVVDYITELEIGLYWNERRLIDSLSAVFVSQQVLTCFIQVRVPLDVGRPIYHCDRVTRFLGCLNRVLIDRCVDQPEVVLNLDGLRTLPRPKKTRDTERGKQRNYRYYNHNLDEGKTVRRTI
jgi:hypothetical protein